MGSHSPVAESAPWEPLALQQAVGTRIIPVATAGHGKSRSLRLLFISCLGDIGLNKLNLPQ